MFDPGPCVYMEKIAVGPDAAGVIDITASVTENLHAVAKAKGESVRDLTVVILDRDRHADLIAEVRDGRRPGPAHLRRRRLRRHRHGVARRRRRRPARHRRHARGRHRRRRAEVHGRRAPGPALAAQRRRARRPPRPPATTSTRCSPPTTSCSGDNCFFAATGITDGELLRGVRFDPQRRHDAVARHAVAQSGTVRLVNARHRLDKLQQYATVDYA